LPGSGETEDPALRRCVEKEKKRKSKKEGKVSLF